MPSVSKNENTHFIYHVNDYIRHKLFINIDYRFFKQNVNAVVDTGSFLNIFPLQLYNQIGHGKKLEKSDVSVKGIGNCPMQISGSFETIIQFGSGFVKHVKFHVIDAAIPPLIV